MNAFPKMKTLLKKLLRRLANVPVVGRFVRIAAAIYRLPDQHEYPQATKRDLDNLVVSVPVALRKLRRDVDRLETMLADLDRRNIRSLTGTPNADQTSAPHSHFGTKP